MLNIVVSIVLFVYIVFALIFFDNVLRSSLVTSKFKNEPKIVKYIMCFSACLLWPIAVYKAYRRKDND